MATLKIPVTTSDHSQGPEDAAITLVEYGDYQCPHCGHAYPIIKQVQEHFGKRLRFVFRNFPLNEIHPQAELAAESAEFAATKGKFWQMHDAIFENQKLLSDQFILELGERLGLPATELAHALKAGVYTQHVKSDFIGGARSGVNGTPTFFINNLRHEGAFEFENLVEAIEATISDQG